MSSWRPELTAIAAETDALGPALRVPATRGARRAATRAGAAASRAGACACSMASDVLGDRRLARGHLRLAELIGPPAVIAPGWLLAVLCPVLVLAGSRSSPPTGSTRARVRRSRRPRFDEVANLFHALLAGSLVLLVIGQGLKKGFDVFIYSPLEALMFLGLAVVAVPVLRGVVRTWLLPNLMAPAPHADRRRRRGRAHARAQDRLAPGVRPRAGRLRRRRLDGRRRARPHGRAGRGDRPPARRPRGARLHGVAARAHARARARGAPAGRPPLDRPELLRAVRLQRRARGHRGRAGGEPALDAALAHRARAQALASTWPRRRPGCSR